MTLGHELLERIPQLRLAEEIAYGCGVGPLRRHAKVSFSFDQDFVVSSDMFAALAPVQEHLLAAFESTRPSFPLGQKLNNSRCVVALAAAVHSLMVGLKGTPGIEEGLTARLWTWPE
jgi:hypothetical protein